MRQAAELGKVLVMNGTQLQLQRIAKEAYVKDLDTDDETVIEPYFLKIIEIATDEKEEAVEFFRRAI